MNEMKRVLKISGLFAALLMFAVIAPKVIKTPVVHAAGDVAINETNFPDKFFREYISKTYDTNKDGKFSSSEIESVVDLNLYTTTYVQDLKGIEFFTSMETFSLNCLYLTDVDLSKNTNLKYLYCYGEDTLENLKISNCTKLVELRVSDSLIQPLDLSKFPALEYLDCSNNGWAKLDVSNNKKLKYLDCSKNKIQTLSLSANTLLTELNCSSNALSSLNVNSLQDLENLDCSKNKIKTLNFDENDYLTKLDCSSNALSSLKISQNYYLAKLDCSSNSLSSIEVHSLYDLVYIDCSQNKIQVLDVSYTPELEYLDCSQNKMTELRLRYWSDNEELKLKELDCSQNSIQSLNLSEFIYLSRLNCSSNSLSSLNVSDNTVLQYFKCDSNNLTSLDLSSNINLKNLDCSFNKLKSLNVSKNKKLYSLSCYGNNITTLNISNIEDLATAFIYGTKEKCSDNGYEYLYYWYCSVSDVQNDEGYLRVDKFVNVWPITPLSKPKDVKASAVSESSIKVSWSKVDGATGYQVWRSTSSNGTYTSLGSVTTTSKTSVSLKPGTKYYYKVRAYYEVNDTKSFTDYSSVVSATTKSDAPSNVKAVSASSTSIKVSWSAVSGATGYEVYRATSANGSFTCLGWVSGTSKTSTGLTAGKTYYYKVRFFKTVDGKKVYSDYSQVVNAIPKPSKPTNIKLSVVNPTTVKISWTVPSDVEYVQIWRASKANAAQSEYSLIQTCEKATTSAKSNYLTPNKTYYYKLRSYVVNSSGTKVYSPFSTVYSIKPSVSVGVPSGLKVSATTSSSIKLTWNAVSGTNIRYEVLRKDGTSEVVVNRTKNTSITDTGLTSKKSYSYRIRAYYYYTDAKGNGHRIYGDYTSYVKGTTK